MATILDPVTAATIPRRVTPFTLLESIFSLRSHNPPETPLIGTIPVASSGAQLLIEKTHRKKKTTLGGSAIPPLFGIAPSCPTAPKLEGSVRRTSKGDFSKKKGTRIVPSGPPGAGRQGVGKRNGGVKKDNPPAGKRLFIESQSTGSIIVQRCRWVGGEESQIWRLTREWREEGTDRVFGRGGYPIARPTISIHGTVGGDRSQGRSLTTPHSGQGTYRGASIVSTYNTPKLSPENLGWIGTLTM